MAEKQETAETLEAPKKKSKLPLIIVVVTVLLAGGGGAAFYFMQGKKPAEGGEAAEKVSDKPPIYVKMDTFTVNLQRGENDSDDHYLQLDANLKVQEEKVNEALKIRMPEIRNAILLLLSSKTKDDLNSLEGKQKLSNEIVAQINKIIGSKKPAQDGVLGVYFTSFIIQ